MREWIAEALYKIGLKRLAYRISSKVYMRMTFRKLGDSIAKVTESFKNFTDALSEWGEEKNGG